MVAIARFKKHKCERYKCQKCKRKFKPYKDINSASIYIYLCPICVEEWFKFFEKNAKMYVEGKSVWREFLKAKHKVKFVFR